MGRGEDLYILKLDVTKDESVNDAKVAFNFKTSGEGIAIFRYVVYRLRDRVL